MQKFLLFSCFLAAAAAVDLRSIYTEDRLRNISSSVQEDARLDFLGLTKKYGYPGEVHTVITEDGYMLSIHRIPFGKKCGPNNGSKIPVFLAHGLFSQSLDYIIMGPKDGLGYILADECYDVWMSNSRGNTFSKKHTSLSIFSTKFWDFSWHELGVYDVPAVINYILKETGQPNLHYIGHSQGTTQFFVFASTYPELATKTIKSFQALAPVVYVSNVNHPLLPLLKPFLIPLETIAKIFGIRDVPCDLVNIIGPEFCDGKNPTLSEICSNIMFMFNGFDVELLNKTMIPAILGHSPAGASIKQVLHYSQSYRLGKFCQYDHGLSENLGIYGQLEPPFYPLEKIKVPVALYFSNNDWLHGDMDLERLVKKLPNVVLKYQVPFEKFNHLDFIWAINAKTLLYDKVISTMKKFE